MTDHPTQPDFDPVMALADGEASLGAPAPTGGALADQLRHQAQLRRAAKQAANTAADTCPDALRAQILAMMAAPQTTQSSANPKSAPVAGRIQPPVPTAGAFAPRRWHKFALVATLALVASAGFLAGEQGWHPPIGQSALAEDRLADRLAARNAFCSEHTELVQNLNLMDAKGNQTLPDLVLKDAGKTLPFSLNLSKLGYNHCLIGACTVPGPNTVHLLYRNDAGSTLSLWIRKDDGRVPTAPGRVRLTLLPERHKAVASWRDNTGVEYHAVAPTLVELRRLLVWMGSATDEVK